MLYRATPRLGVGLEFNPVVGEVVPNFNWIAMTETESLPMVTFGLSSDRIFTDEGNLAFMTTFAKSIPGTSLAPYVGVNYSQAEDGWLFPAGVNWTIDEHWSLLPMYDGRNGHLMLTYAQKNWNVTGLYLKGQRWGLSIGIGF